MSELSILRAEVTRLDADRQRLRAELSEIHERAGAEPLSAGQQTRFDNIERAIAKTNLAYNEARDQLTDAIERGMVGGSLSIEGGSPQAAPQVLRRVDPSDPTFDTYSRAMSTAENMTRMASEFAVTDAAVERSVELVERGRDDDHLAGIEQHTIVLGDPDYARACQKFFRDPIMGLHLLTEPEARAFERARAFGGREIRSAMSLTGANGGAMVPHFLDPTINQTNASSNNAIRQLATVTPILTTTWEGVNSAGVTAEWLGEGVEAADASPVFTSPTVTTQKAAAWLYGSYEVLADSGFDQVSELINSARDRLEETAFTTGTGSSQPYGLITRLSGTGPSLAGSSGAAGAADFVIADVYALKNGLTPRFRRNASWMGNPATLDVIRQFGNSTAGTNAANFWTDLGADIPSSLLGKPVYENEAMDSTRVSGSNDDILLFGDVSQYRIVDRVGLVMLYNPMVMGSANQRPTGQAGWFGYWRVGADVQTSNGFRLLKI